MPLNISFLGGTNNYHRIKAVLLANDGWTYLQISEALLLDEQTISRHVHDYKAKKKLSNKSGGSESQLNTSQTDLLIK